MNSVNHSTNLPLHEYIPGVGHPKLASWDWALKKGLVKGCIRVVVVDDMRVERLVLKNLVRSYDALELVGEAENALDGAKKIRVEKPDVVFLDVHMPGGDGFGLLQSLETPPHVVFVSASPGYAVQAFSVDAVDYLLKPVSPERFAATVVRLKRAVLKEEDGAEVRYGTLDRICLRTTERTHILPVQSIMALEADGDFTRTIIAEEPHPIVACRRLGDLDALLPSGNFLRVDRSLIINLYWVTRLERVSRNVSHLWMKGLRRPLNLGRTATERLRGEIKVVAA